MSIPTAEEKQIRPVSRAEFYGTVSTLYFLPPMIFLISGGFEDLQRGGESFLAWVRLATLGFMFLAMMGASITYSIMAFREKGKKRL